MVTIIIASENTKEALTLCLLSIRKYTKAPYRVIVIDNSSTDGTLKLLEQFPWVKVVTISGIKMGERHGRALDIGAQKVRTKYFLAMDSDVEILDFNWLTEMLKKITENDGAFVGELAPRLRHPYWGNFKERVLPYCLLVNTEFFKKNNCSFVPQYRWGYKGYQSDVGADILHKAENSNQSYGVMDENIANKFSHYGSLTAANLFATKEWKDEFESNLNNDSKLNVSQKKEFKNFISQLIKTSKDRTGLINHRIDLIKKGPTTKTSTLFIKNSKRIKDTLKGLASRLYYLAENYFNSENYEASISKLKEAQHYTNSELNRWVMARLALTYSKNKMPGKAGKALSILTNLKPREAEILYSMGSLYKEKTDFENAEKFYKKALRAHNKQQDKFCAGAYFHLGEISLNSKKITQAIEYFGLCLKLYPTHQKASNYLAAINPIANSK